MSFLDDITTQLVHCENGRLSSEHWTIFSALWAWYRGLHENGYLLICPTETTSVMNTQCAHKKAVHCDQVIFDKNEQNSPYFPNGHGFVGKLWFFSGLDIVGHNGPKLIPSNGSVRKGPTKHIHRDRSYFVILHRDLHCCVCTAFQRWKLP